QVSGRAGAAATGSGARVSGVSPWSSAGAVCGSGRFPASRRAQAPRPPRLRPSAAGGRSVPRSGVVLRVAGEPGGTGAPAAYGGAGAGAAAGSCAAGSCAAGTWGAAPPGPGAAPPSVQGAGPAGAAGPGRPVAGSPSAGRGRETRRPLGTLGSSPRGATCRVRSPEPDG